MTLRAILMFGFAASIVLGTIPAQAQKIGVERRPPAPERRIEIVPPPLSKDVSRPSDGEYYPNGPRVQHDPAFIEPMTMDTEDGRLGASGWTAPQVPVGPIGNREQNGWFAVGLSFTWGGPATAPRPAR